MFYLIKRIILSLFLLLGGLTLYLHLYALEKKNKMDLPDNILQQINILNESQDTSEFAHSLTELVKSLNNLSKDIMNFLNTLNISDIDLFKNYKEKIRELCTQELTLNKNEFLENSYLIEIRNFSDLLNEISDQIKENFTQDSEITGENIETILIFLRTKAIDWILAPLFEQFDGQNCAIVLYRILNSFGLDILRDPKSSINIKKLLDQKNTIINSLLDNLSVQSIYDFIISNKLNELLPLLNRLYSKGFGIKIIVDSLAQAIALFLHDKGLKSTNDSKSINDRSEVDKLLAFVKNDIMKSKYRFEGYPKLIDQYINSYILMNYLRAEFEYTLYIRLLLNKRVAINARDSEGNTPLIYAISRKTPVADYIKMLINNGADVNLPGKDGVTPLMKAILRDNIDAIKILLERGADLSVKDIYGNDVWMLAAENSSIKNLLKNEKNKIEQQQINILKELTFSLNSLTLR